MSVSQLVPVGIFSVSVLVSVSFNPSLSYNLFHPEVYSSTLSQSDSVNYCFQSLKFQSVITIQLVSGDMRHLSISKQDLEEKNLSEVGSK